MKAIPQQPLVAIGTKMTLSGIPVEVTAIDRDIVTVKDAMGCILGVDPKRLEQSVLAQRNLN